MELYIASRLVLAKPMSKKDYNDYMGYFYILEDFIDEDGYLVEFKFKPKEKNISIWLDKEQFEKSHIKVNKNFLNETLV